MWFWWYTLQNDLAVHMQNRQSCGQSQFAKNLPNNLILNAVLRIRIQVRMDPAFISDPGELKWPTKIEKMKKFQVLKCWMFSF
jgi:hypothetical protein